MSIIKYIAKMEGGAPVLFFPEMFANRGRIVCYAHVGQHSEACMLYYKGLRNAKVENAAALVKEYAHNYLEEGESLLQVTRDSRKMQKSRWGIA